MAWLPLDQDSLRIGLHIKLDHSWMEHPFVRNVFTVSSPTEIAIIRKHHLTKLFYDPKLSHADVVASLNQPSTPVCPPEVNVEADEQVFLKEKQLQLQTALEHRKAIEENHHTYAQAMKEVSVVMAMANAGKSGTIQSAMKILESMGKVMAQEPVVLSLVSAESQAEPGQELAVQAMNVSVLAMLTAKTLGLSWEETERVGLAGLFHNIGMNRVPLAVRLKSERDLSPTEIKLLRMYPQLGKEILETLPGVDSEIIEIVYQHREYLDGTGYPKRLMNGDIARTARLLGMITEYDLRVSDRRLPGYLGPSHALTFLYTKRRNKYGPDVVDPFIATITVFPPGSFVELNDGSFGLVIKINKQERMRPVIMLYDPNASHDQATIIDLVRERSLSIEKSLAPKTLPKRVKNALLSTQLNGYLMTGN